MGHFYQENFAEYKDLFQEEASQVAKMMEIVDQAVNARGLSKGAYIEAKALFDMVMELRYSVDNKYRKKHGIEEFQKEFFSTKTYVEVPKGTLPAVEQITAESVVPLVAETTTPSADTKTDA